MVKKVLLASLLFALLTGVVFSQQSRHQEGDLLIGINIGASVSPNFFNVLSDDIPKGNYGLAVEAGVNVDYYLFSWLSFNSGLLIRPGLYLLEDSVYFQGRPPGMPPNVPWDRGDWYKRSLIPLCLTIPVMAHVNIPVLDFLYVGAGVNLNIPMLSWMETDAPAGTDTKGGFFIGVPIDIGFDFIKGGNGGSRLIFRVTPEFHKGGTPVLFGLIWQIHNFKIM